MGRKLVLLNILMLVALVVVAQHLIGSWRDFERNQEPIEAAGSEVKLQETSLPERLAPISHFLDIGAGNLFSEQRGQDPNEGLEVEGEAPTELSPEPKLTSVMTFGKQKTAVLSIAANRRSRSPAEVIRVKLGDEIQGYTVAEIEDDRIVLSWREHRREIFLDPAQAQPRKAARAAGGPKIIVVGAPAAAVATTTLASAAEPGRGVQVGTVGSAGQGGGRSGGGGRGLAGGRGGGGSSGRGGLGGGGTRGSGTLGGGGLGGGRGTRGQWTQQQRPPGD